MPTGTGHVNWSDLYRLNQPTAQAMANAVINPISDEGAAAKEELDALLAQFGQTLGVQDFDPNANETQAREFSNLKYAGPDSLSAMDRFKALQERGQGLTQNASTLGTTGGVQGQLAQKYGNATGFDALLAQSAGGPRFGELQKQYGDFSKALGTADANSYTQANAARTKAASNAEKYGALAEQRKADAARRLVTRPSAPLRSEPVMPEGLSGRGQYEWKMAQKRKAGVY